MPSVCLHLSMHQPIRLRRCSPFGAQQHYFDDKLNARVLSQVARQCYEPALRRLLKLVRHHRGRFRLALGPSGVLLEQLREHCPAVLDRLIELAETDAVEFAASPYYHSLAGLYSPDEFRAQADRHAATVEELFGQRPRTFANTELIYSDALAEQVAAMDQHEALVTEGADALLADRSPHHLYRAGDTGMKLILRHPALSDDLAFRFSDERWDQHPLSPETFAGWIHRSIAASGGELCGLFLDLEAFGGRHSAASGIFEFLDRLPGAAMAHNLDFKTLGEAAEAGEPTDRIDAPQPVSWADHERDLSAWLGNAMQRNAVQELYRLEEPIKAREDPALLEAWRRLTVSDHAYYMATKHDTDGAAHSAFSPYASPYDAYINFMNALDGLRSRLDR